MSKEELVEELKKAWEAGDTEKVVMIIKESPELTKNFELIRKTEKIPFYRKYSDFSISLLISAPLSFVFVYLGIEKTLSADNNLKLVLLGFLLIGISTSISSLISLKPFGYRSLRIPIWISILTMEIANIIYFTLDSYNTYLVSNATTPFLEYYISNSVVSIILGGVTLALFGTICVGFVSMYLTRFLIGIPEVDEPYSVSFDILENFEQFKEILIRELNSHFLFGELTKYNQSWFGEFTTKERFQESVEYVAAVEVRELEKNLSVKMLFYRKGGGRIPRIVRDDSSEMLGYEIATSLTTKFEEPSPFKVEDYDELYDFTLGYTSNWLQGLIDRNWPRLGRKAYIIIGSLVTISLIIYYWNEITKHLAPIKDAIIIVSAIAGILSCWFGYNRYRKKE